MSYIIDGIDFFVSTLTSIWNFFQGIIENFILFFKYLSVVFGLCISLILNMPSWLQVFGFITITVSVLYLILGRQTGGKKE